MTTTNALAETQVNVPFSFTVNGKVCPAGLYTLDRNLASNVVTLRNDDWKSSFTWIAGAGDPAPTDSRVILRFDEDGLNHTLQSVQSWQRDHIQAGWEEERERGSADPGGHGPVRRRTSFIRLLESRNKQ